VTNDVIVIKVDHNI